MALNFTQRDLSLGVQQLELNPGSPSTPTADPCSSTPPSCNLRGAAVTGDSCRPTINMGPAGQVEVGAAVRFTGEHEGLPCVCDENEREATAPTCGALLEPQDGSSEWPAIGASDSGNEGGGEPNPTAAEFKPASDVCTQMAAATPGAHQLVGQEGTVVVATDLAVQCTVDSLDPSAVRDPENEADEGDNPVTQANNRRWKGKEVARDQYEGAVNVPLHSADTRLSPEYQKTKRSNETILNRERPGKGHAVRFLLSSSCTAITTSLTAPAIARVY